MTLTEVSIHAPARGATLPGTRSSHPFLSFNPRPRAGGDPARYRHRIPYIPVSIHAPARGATEGYRKSHKSAYVSIHAPARGATSWDAAMIDPKNVSIHAPARGATHSRL